MLAPLTTSILKYHTNLDHHRHANSDQASSRFLALPLELTEQIYRYTRLSSSPSKGDNVAPIDSSDINTISREVLWTRDIL